MTSNRIQRTQQWFRVLGLLFIVMGLLSLIAPATRAQTDGETIYLIEIHETIDLGLAPFLDRVISEAEANGVSALILDINTPGGRLDAALQMRQSLLGADVPTIAFINREAFSAGALIAIAAEEIYMTPGAVMGAATPVLGTGETADEKTISAVRSTFRSTADTRGRDPNVAAAMVDPRIAIDGLVSDQELLTLTSAEAIEWGYSEGTVSNLNDLLATIGLDGAVVEEIDQSWAESLVRFLTNPVVASLLFSMGSLLIVVDILSGELSPLSLVGVGGLALFFWGHFLAGLAGMEGVLLVLLGLALILIEIFLIPGFGVFGLLGLASLMGGLFLSLYSDELVTPDDLQRAGLTVAATTVVILVGIVLIFIFLPTVGRFRGLVLTARLGEDEPVREPRRVRRWFGRSQPDTSPEPPRLLRNDQPQSLVGARGVALSDLRPGGFARINGQRVDVVTQGDYVRAGDHIVVIADERYRRVVRLVAPEEEAPAAETDVSGE
jgi:membrane-bound serine protease (ClpP class)